MWGASFDNRRDRRSSPRQLCNCRKTLRCHSCNHWHSSPHHRKKCRLGALYCRNFWIPLLASTARIEDRGGVSYACRRFVLHSIVLFGAGFRCPRQALLTLLDACLLCFA